MTVGAVLESREASTSTGAFTASPFFFASSMALLLRAVFASVWPFLPVFTVPVEPSAALFSVTELPSFLVSVLEVLPSLAVVVLVVEPSALFFVSVLIMGLLSELSRSEEEPPPEDPPVLLLTLYGVMLPVSTS